MVDNSIMVSDDVGVVKLGEDVDLGDQLVLLVLRHGAVVHLFPYEEAAIDLLNETD